MYLLNYIFLYVVGTMCLWKVISHPGLGICGTSNPPAVQLQNISPLIWDGASVQLDGEELQAFDEWAITQLTSGCDSPTEDKKLKMVNVSNVYSFWNQGMIIVPACWKIVLTYYDAISEAPSLSSLSSLCGKDKLMKYSTNLCSCNNLDHCYLTFMSLACLPLILLILCFYVYSF